MDEALVLASGPQAHASAAPVSASGDFEPDAHRHLRQMRTDAVGSWQIRTGCEGDAAFIVACWAETFRSSTGALKHCPSSYFSPAVYGRLTKLIARCTLRVAADLDDERVIYGFAAYEPGLMHMVFVRNAWRRLGLGRALVAGLPLADMDYSTPSRDFREWVREKVPLRAFRPFYLEEL